MRDMKSVLLILAACFAAAACAQDIDRYAYFGKYGVLDPGVSNRTANALVREGIRSEDPKIVELTIRALNRYTPKQHPEFVFRSPYGMHPDRNFADIPGLKEFLIGYWRERQRLGGGARSREASSTAPASEELSRLLNEAAYPKLPDAQLSLSALADELTAFPAWPAIPGILAALYPGDADVLRFIWERNELGSD